MGCPNLCLSLGLHCGVDSILESLLGGVLGPGDGGDDLRQELDEESKYGRLLYLHHLEDMWCRTVGDCSKWRDGSRQ